MRIKRRQVIQAIRTEHKLKKGRFIFSRTSDTDPYTEIYDNRCPVCAVGAVLRQVGVRSEDIFGVADIYVAPESDGESRGVTSAKDIAFYLERRDYLAALSCKFESTKGRDKERREEVIAWVKKTLPKQFNMPGLQSWVVRE